MGTLVYRDAEVYAEVLRATVEAGRAVGQNAVDTAKSITRERAYATGYLLSRWFLFGVLVLGSIVRVTVENDAFYVWFIDKGTRFIAPRNISGSTLDIVGPTFAREIAARVNLS